MKDDSKYVQVLALAVMMIAGSFAAIADTVGFVMINSSL